MTVELLNAGGRVVATTTTSPGGYYSFRFAAPGNYTVRIIPPAGYVANNTSTTLMVRMFEVVRVDFVLNR